jgi:hypothetical protein
MIAPVEFDALLDRIGEAFEALYELAHPVAGPEDCAHSFEPRPVCRYCGKVVWMGTKEIRETESASTLPGSIAKMPKSPGKVET